MRAVAVASNRQQAFWLLHLLLHAVVTLMLSARLADLPSKPREPAAGAQNYFHTVQQAVSR
jgi:hypothetical protein